VAIARAIRRLVRLVPDFREDSNTGLEIGLWNIFDEFGAQIVGGIKNLLQDCLGTPLKVDCFAPAIFRRTAAFDPAVGFQPIEQTGKSRAFDSHPFRDFLLGELIAALGKVNERPPFSLAQAQRSQAPIEPGPPGAGGAEKDETEFVDIGRWHTAEWLAC
jgi:hypothetical protein